MNFTRKLGSGGRFVDAVDQEVTAAAEFDLLHNLEGADANSKPRGDAQRKFNFEFDEIPAVTAFGEAAQNHIASWPRAVEVLVVIPVFNRETMIIEALNSVFAQTRPPDQVVVVDDGSTDQTGAAVEGWVEKNPHCPLVLVRSGRRGASAARNLGFSARWARTEFVAFLDSDDLWPSDFLERAVAGLKRDADAMLAVADRRFVNVDGGLEKFVSSLPFVRDPLLQIIRIGAGYGSAVLMRANPFEATGGYPEDVPTGHDIILFERLNGMGHFIHNAGQPVTMRTWRPSPEQGQEPHLHLRYPDRYIRWAETYLEVCERRARRSGINKGQELRYQMAITYRFILALGLELWRMRFDQAARIVGDFRRLGRLMVTTIIGRSAGSAV
jgi:glycosyltransferase involved in cell wall biosynthesis